MANPPFRLKADLDVEATRRAFETAPQRTAQIIRDMLQTTVSAIKMDLIYKHLTGGTTPTRLARRRGTLIRSLRTRVSGNTLAGLKGEVGFVDPGGVYAPTHVFGADIVSKTGKYLAIPLDAVKTAGGKVRGGPRSGLYDNMFARRSRAGNLILWGMRKQGGPIVRGMYRAIEPLFVLKRSVHIPPRVDMFGVAEFHVRLLERTADKRLASELARKQSMAEYWSRQ